MIRSITKKFADAKLVFEYDPDTKKTTIQILALETIRSGKTTQAELDDDEMTALCSWCAEAGFLAFDETRPSREAGEFASPVMELPTRIPPGSGQRPMTQAEVDSLKFKPITMPLATAPRGTEHAAFTGDY